MEQWWEDVSDGADRVNSEQLSRIVKANYTPSEVEVKHIVDWLDINKDGRITFDEYCLGMAKVLERANLTANDDLAAFEEAMSDDLALLLLGDDDDAPSGAPLPPSPLVRVPSKGEVYGEKIVTEVKSRLGEDLLVWLKAHFDEADTDSTGDLDQKQVEALVSKTYVPRGHHLERFMKWFAHAMDLETDTISKVDYLDCMVKLHTDLNFILSPSPSPQLSELLSPKHSRSQPNSPVVLSAVDFAS